MTIQRVAVHENEVVNMVHQTFDDVEVFYDQKTGEGVIFWQDVEIECRVTAALNLMLCRISEAAFFEKVAILQEIKRMSDTLNKILSL